MGPMDADTHVTENEDGQNLNIDDMMTMDMDRTEDACRLMSAVSRATGRTLRHDVLDDVIAVQVGCNILNHWGHGPRFDYDRCYYCPHSEELDGEFVRAGTIPDDLPTDIPQESIGALSDIFSNGKKYAIAYATMLSAMDINPGWTVEAVKRIVHEVDPDLRDVLDAVVSSLPQ